MSPTPPEGYLARPAAGQGPAVLVLHAWWGLNATIRAFCDRLAASGFVAFAPDLYHGQVTDQIPEAEKLSAALGAREDQVWADLTAAMAFLKEQAGTGDSGIAVIGFSLGAYFALALSVHAPETIRSVVLFYGTGPTDFSGAHADYFGHFAEKDPFEPLPNVDSLKEALEAAGRPVTFHVYPETGHWFFEPDRTDAYDPTAASLAWERTLAFLNHAASQ